MSATFRLLETLEKKTLKVSGELVGKANEKFKSELQSLRKTNGAIELCFLETVSMDVSSIQLIYALRQAMEKKIAKLHVVPPADTRLCALLSKTKLMSIMDMQEPMDTQRQTT